MSQPFEPVTRRTMLRRSLGAAAASTLPFLSRPNAAAALSLPGLAPVTGMSSNDEIYQTITEITAHGARRIGSPGLDYAVGYVYDRFREYGLSDVHVEVAPTYSWDVVDHGLAIGGRAIDAFPVAWSQVPSADHVGDTSTPAGGLRAGLVDGGFGTPAELAGKDLKGKIVIFDLKFVLPLAALAPITEFLWDPDNTLEKDTTTLIATSPYETTYGEIISGIAGAGAAGFIGVLADYFDSNRYYNENYASPPIPGMWVTKAEGARIRSQLSADANVQANMVMHTRRAKVSGHAVVGYLDGRSADTILVTSHHDTVWDGAVEDASGTAEVLALAKYYARQPYHARQKSLMFVTFDTHFSGYQMHAAFATRHYTKRTDPHKPVAVVTLEHICKHAEAGADGQLVVSDLPELRGVFETLGPALKADLIKAIVDNDLRRTAVLNAEALQPTGIPTDSSWSVLLGLPTASLIAGPVYLYDEADMTDKVLKDELQQVAVTFAQLIDRIDATPTDQIGLPPAYAWQSTAPPSTDAPPPQNPFSPAGHRPQPHSRVTQHPAHHGHHGHHGHHAHHGRRSKRAP